MWMWRGESANHPVQPVLSPTVAFWHVDGRLRNDLPGATVLCPRIGFTVSRNRIVFSIASYFVQDLLMAATRPFNCTSYIARTRTKESDMPAELHKRVRAGQTRIRNGIIVFIAGVCAS